MASRLKTLTPKIIKRNQVGFIKGQLLCENVLWASELVADFYKDDPMSGGCLQIDITKAYDNVEWEFFLNILEALELPEVFMRWIELYITTTYFSVAINGDLVGLFCVLVSPPVLRVLFHCNQISSYGETLQELHLEFSLPQRLGSLSILRLRKLTGSRWYGINLEFLSMLLCFG